MLLKDLHNITESDLQDLVTNEVVESRTIEYKLSLPGSGDEDKKEFLADVSAFANTIGGDLVFGIDEKDGVPVKIEGIDCSNLDAEMLRLESIITTGLQPRVSHNIQPIKLSSGKNILVIRIRNSLLAPHRVIFKNLDRFYGRNSTGKYSLDVDQLRTAFLQSGSFEEKIKEFHTTRIMEIEAGRAQLPLIGKSKIIINVIPLESITSRISLTSNRLHEIQKSKETPLKLINDSGWFAPQINVDGLIIHYGENRGQAQTYTQLYRNGIIEHVESYLLDDDSDKIRTYIVESEIIRCINNDLNYLRTLGFNTPFFVFITYTNIKGKLPMDKNREAIPFPLNILRLPSVIIENFDQNLEKSLKPSFDIFWNGCNLPNSKNFTETGDWIKGESYM